jgi:chromosome segregation ATPase
MSDMPPEILAVRLARQRATQVREAAERALRDAERAEAELALEEEREFAALVAAKRERLTARVDLADTFVRKATEALTILQLKLRSAASNKSRAEARLAALEEEILEQKQRIRAGEATERKLQHDLRNVERAAEACRDLRNTAEAALRNLTSPETPSSASFAQRVEERRGTERRTGGLEHPHQVAV